MVEARDSIDIRSVISRKERYGVIALFVFVTLLLSYLMVTMEAFEAFYEYSRSHESWELDEILLILISLLIALAVSALVASFIISRRMQVLAREQVEYERKMQNGRKQQALGSMLGGLSHSLNNHLLPILTISRMLKSEHPEGSETHEDLSHIQQAAESARLMLQQVLNFTRQEEQDYSNSCVVAESLETGLRLAKAAIPSAIKLKTDIPDTPLISPLSRLNLEVILLNLVMNSVDAIEAKQSRTGEIEVSLKLPQPGAKKDFVQVQVRDSGIGVTVEQQRRMFDPFYTTKAAGKGTGLGLAETLGIVRAAGGEIEVDSEPGLYTAITLSLPVMAT